MKTKRSMWMGLLFVASAGFLVTNCTIKSDDDTDDGSACTPGATRTGCECADKSEGFQTCSSEGVYGGCQCSPANEAGASNAGGGGASAGSAGSAGEGGSTSPGDAGAGGEAGGESIDPLDCYGCLTKLCAPEWDACAAEDENNPPDTSSPGDYCLSSTADDSGQIEKIMLCITDLRSKGLAKREAVRSCGASLGASSDPQFFEWPPAKMTPATEVLMNCMADAPDEVNTGAWASSEVVNTPWVDMTCAKLACTSAL